MHILQPRVQLTIGKYPVFLDLKILWHPKYPLCDTHSDMQYVGTPQNIQKA